VIQKCKAIVLKTTKYSESSFIVNCYTNIFGKLSFIISGIRNKKSKKAALFQTLSLLELDIYYKEKREIHRIKEVQVVYPFVSLTADIYKSTISFFIAELLIKTLREQENNNSLFHFIENSIITLDLLSNPKQIASFHLAFLVQYSRHLGFFPTSNFNEIDKYFNLEKARFVSIYENETYLLDEQFSQNMAILIQAGYNSELILNRIQRNTLLNQLINFYIYHLDTNLKFKSLEILSELFA